MFLPRPICGRLCSRGWSERIWISDYFLNDPKSNLMASGRVPLSLCWSVSVAYSFAFHNRVDWPIMLLQHLWENDSFET